MNLLAAVKRLLDADQRDQVFRAVVDGTDGEKVTIVRTGQASADTQSYPRLASYTSPQQGDEVLVVRVAGGYVVLGEILRTGA